MFHNENWLQVCSAAGQNDVVSVLSSSHMLIVKSSLPRYTTFDNVICHRWCWISWIHSNLQEFWWSFQPGSITHYFLLGKYLQNSYMIGNLEFADDNMHAACKAEFQATSDHISMPVNVVEIFWCSLYVYIQAKRADWDPIAWGFSITNFHSNDIRHLSISDGSRVTAADVKIKCEDPEILNTIWQHSIRLHQSRP